MALIYVPKKDTSLATVATSGSYNDLSNKPNLSQYATTTALNNGLAGRATIADNPSGMSWSSVQNSGNVYTNGHAIRFGWGSDSCVYLFVDQTLICKFRGYKSYGC